MDNKERGARLSATAARTFTLIAAAANAVTHADGGILELTDDEGYTARIPITSAATLTAPDAYGYYGGAGFMIGEWDEAAMALGIDDENGSADNSDEERTDGGEDVME